MCVRKKIKHICKGGMCSFGTRRAHGTVVGERVRVTERRLRFVREYAEHTRSTSFSLSAACLALLAALALSIIFLQWLRVAMTGNNGNESICG